MINKLVLLLDGIVFDYGVSQNNSDSRTPTRGRYIGGVRDKSAPTADQMMSFMCIIATRGGEEEMVVRGSREWYDRDNRES
jgi:hypothetical protein